MKTHGLTSLLVVFMAGLVFISACRKSAKDSAEQKAIQKHEQELQQQKAADRAFQKQLKMPGARESLEAGRFLLQLRESGRLPGAENAELGATLGSPSATTSQSTTYPLTRTLVGQRTLDGPWENHYTVIKISSNSPWQLERAWRTDAQGNTAEEYRVK